MSAGTDRIGIIGAGKLGTALGRLLVAAGYQVTLSSRQQPSALQLMLDILVPGAHAAASQDIPAESDAVVLALPLNRLDALPGGLADVLVIDATNYWQPVDGDLPAFTGRTVSSSEVVAGIVGATRLVKAFSHLGYHDLDQGARPVGHRERSGLALAADDPDDAAAVATIVERVGFDPVVLTPLAAGVTLEGGHPAFGALLPAEELRELLRGSATPGIPRTRTIPTERTGNDRPIAS